VLTALSASSTTTAETAIGALSHPLVEQPWSRRRCRSAAGSRARRRHGAATRRSWSTHRPSAREALGRRLAKAPRSAIVDGVAAPSSRAAAHRIEVYDNSHIQGSNPVGAMIVVGPAG